MYDGRRPKILKYCIIVTILAIFVGISVETWKLLPLVVVNMSNYKHFSKIKILNTESVEIRMTNRSGI